MLILFISLETDSDITIIFYLLLNYKIMVGLSSVICSMLSFI